MTGHETTPLLRELSNDPLRRTTQYHAAGVNARLKLFALLEAQGVTAVSKALVGIADREWSRRRGRSAGAAELAVQIADVRQRERADLARLERFVRQDVLPGTHPHTTARRRVLEALGEAGGLCTARTRNADGDVIVCTLEAGHYDPDNEPPFKDGKPGGWHKAGASIWNDSGAACIPHATL
ncbi:hypothetical protein [Streptomyces flavofungini]|uniref:hypothetical protein n=1 Tax=Streptomyces flavofungini TaxID=68200 RepID=UPI0025AF58F5|nr:hypothetical protein [Streptomyces flavofungini]WJV51892.1 hypothetical protein QUY26_40785 [Streptomyces flavofungini]